jgi:hypothetical protein
LTVHRKTLRSIHAGYKLALAASHTGHKYGLVDDDIYKVLWNQCQVRAPNLLARHGGIHMVIAKLNAQLKEIAWDNDEEDDNSKDRVLSGQIGGVIRIIVSSSNKNNDKTVTMWKVPTMMITQTMMPMIVSPRMILVNWLSEILDEFKQGIESIVA